MNKSVTIAAVALAAALVLAPMACNRLTHTNYDRIRTGMTVDQVKDILGEPQEVDSGGGEILGVGASGTSMVWRSGNKTITVVFVNNQVVSKSMSNL
ncbi:MAG: DUF3862 domain-containing protein [Planctomycetaceae bacterium]|nr:DUF3862 domain-containing protein [Planctomycetaceae bacterium]